MPCHELVFGILPSNFHSLHLSLKWEWGRAALQVSFPAHVLSLMANQIQVGKSILAQVMTKVSEMEEQFQAYEGKARRCWVQSLPLLWHTWTASGGQSSSRALLLACEQSLCHGTVAGLPWPSTQLDALSKQERIFGSCGDIPVQLLHKGIYAKGKSCSANTVCKSNAENGQKGRILFKTIVLPHFKLLETSIKL